MTAIQSHADSLGQFKEDQTCQRLCGRAETSRRSRKRRRRGTISVPPCSTCLQMLCSRNTVTNPTMTLDMRGTIEYHRILHLQDLFDGSFEKLLICHRAAPLSPHLHLAEPWTQACKNISHSIILSLRRCCDTLTCSSIAKTALILEHWIKLKAVSLMPVRLNLKKLAKLKGRCGSQESIWSKCLGPVNPSLKYFGPKS